MSAERLAGGSGEAQTIFPNAWSWEHLGGTDDYRIQIFTAELIPGLYYLWIATDDSRYRLVTFNVTEAL
ncbi:MAG: hypothetical protein ACUVQS_04985 [Candidatus Bipolaricaulaceae bacterium]